MTYSYGALKVRGKASQLNREQLLIEMVEEELTFGEPKNLMKWLIRFWMIVGGWVMWDQFMNEDDGYWLRLCAP